MRNTDVLFVTFYRYRMIFMGNADEHQLGKNLQSDPFTLETGLLFAIARWLIQTENASREGWKQ